jgi:transcriptional regulator GlxA family with amidase domain
MAMGQMKATTIDPRVVWAVEHMHRCLARPLGYAALASHLKLSTSRFRHIFGTQMGIGPARYLQRLRLRHARVLIERTFLTISDVMVLVGYHDPHRFARDFHRLYGVAPTALRSSGAATPMPYGGTGLVSPDGHGHRHGHRRPHPQHISQAKTRDLSKLYLR